MRKNLFGMGLRPQNETKKTSLLVSILLFFSPFLIACSSESKPPQASLKCKTGILVLGNGQDAGKPQIGVNDDPAWLDPTRRAFASSLALIHYSGATGQHSEPDFYLFDATPDIKEQLHALHQFAGQDAFRLNGIFITHAHIGHYLGLVQLGREAMGAKSIDTYAMPLMAKFLTENGPWSQLVALDNISLQPLSESTQTKLDTGLSVRPFIVPHRDEYAETVGFKITSQNSTALYLPDIDSWDEWAAQGHEISDIIQNTDIAFIDATFFNGDELPGRDMSKIPHPTIQTSMKRLKNLDDDQKTKVHFIHMNHTNPALNSMSAASKAIEKAGFHVARTGDFHCLD